MGWINFCLKTDNEKYMCEAKVYDHPSYFGIRNGRVSKFFVYDDDGSIKWEYDRGWGGPRAPKPLLDALMKKYPGTLPKRKAPKHYSMEECICVSVSSTMISGGVK